MAEPAGRQRAWLDKAGRTLRTARVAQRDGDYDSAVSRAYYVVLQAIAGLLFAERDRLPSHPEMIRRCAGWNRRYTRLDAAGSLSGHLDLADSLRGLGDWRVGADYHEERADVRRAREATTFASKFLRAVEESVP